MGDDPLAEQRQLAVVDAKGRTANHTGSRCIDWKGHRPGENFTVQGNLLEGPQVVDAMAAYNPGEPVRAAPAPVPRGPAAQRRWRPPSPRIGGIVDLAGGAAYGGGLDIGTDLRVDDHTTPITELGRLLDLHFLYFERPDPDTLLPLEGTLATEVGDALTAVGYAPSDYDSLDRRSHVGRG